MNIQECVGKNVRYYRQEKGWSQEELADRAGIHRTYISGVERGVRNPTITVLGIIAEALDVPVEALASDRA